VLSACLLEETSTQAKIGLEWATRTSRLKPKSGLSGPPALSTYFGMTTQKARVNRVQNPEINHELA